MIGNVVSHYRILEKLGEGGMGVVYKAEDLTLTRSVALKFLPQGLETHEAERARFLQEARAAAILNHPNICTVYEIQEHQGQQYIAMEFVEGKTLRDRIRQGAAGGRGPGIGIQDAITYAIQIGEALQEAHTHGIVHRDIKSENIMVNSKNQIKVMDFGLAKLKGSLKLTKTSSTIGTLAYMAPEQIQSGEVDARSDVFSFGVLLFEMLTGGLPFRGEHDAAMMYSILNEEPQALQTFLPEAPSELLHTVNRALEKDPEERYQTVHEMLIDLRRLKKDSGRVARPSVEVPAGAARAIAGAGLLRKLGPRARWIWAAVAVVLAGIIGWIIFRPGGEAPMGPATGKSIAVMYFENRTQEKDLDRILVDMLITNLGRNRQISVVSGQRLYDILKAIGKQDAAVVDQSTATEAAKRAGVRTMLLGNIWDVGGKLNVTAQLLDVESGAVINSDRMEASRPEDVFVIADRLTERVSQWLEGTPTEDLRIADATTGSYDAYRFYEQGMRHEYRFERAEARESFTQAIRLDSTFAMAHLRLSVLQGMPQILSGIPTGDLALARESAERAEQYAGNLSERDRGFLDAWSAFLRRDYARSAEIRATLLRTFPDDKEILAFSANGYLVNGNFEDAILAFEKAIEADRSYSDAYNSLAYTYCDVGQYEKAFATIRTYMALIPDAINAYDSGWEVYTMAGRFDESLKIAEEGARRIPTWTDSYSLQARTCLLMGEPEKARERIDLQVKLEPGSIERMVHMRSMSYCFEGRITDATSILQQQVVRAKARDETGVERAAHFYLARISLELNGLDDVLKELEAVRRLSLQMRNDPSNPWPLVCDYYAGLCYARGGDFENAEARAAAIRTAAETTLREPHYLLYYNGLMAEVHLGRGNAREALSSLKRIVPWIRMHFPRFRMLDAKVSVELRDRKGAAALYDGMRNLTNMQGAQLGGDFLDFWIEQSKLDYYIGRMHEHFGEKDEAVSSYQKALHRWRNADNNYPPSVDARTRLAALAK